MAELREFVDLLRTDSDVPAHARALVSADAAALGVVAERSRRWGAMLLAAETAARARSAT
jgi:hypothetical protein